MSKKTCSRAALSETGATVVGVPRPKFFIRKRVVKFTRPKSNKIHISRKI